MSQLFSTHDESYHDFARRSSVEDTRAYEANHQVFKGGKTKHEVTEYYNKWAESGAYDADLNPDRYSGPELAAQALALNFTSGRETAKVLDIAAGTGRLGAELHRLGFRNIDALDPSEGMLKKAMEKNVYTEFINEFLDADNPLDIQDGTYDGVAVAGGMGEGHIPSGALREMVRLVRSGGVICIAMRKEYLDQVSEYRSTLLPLIDNLQKHGKIVLHAQDEFPNYAFGKAGIIFRFIVC